MYHVYMPINLKLLLTIDLCQQAAGQSLECKYPKGHGYRRIVYQFNHLSIVSLWVALKKY